MVRVMVFNITFNNISVLVISWRSSSSLYELPIGGTPLHMQGKIRSPYIKRNFCKMGLELSSRYVFSYVTCLRNNSWQA